MLLSLAYLVVRMLLRLPVPNGQGEAAKDLEIVVLRHELNGRCREMSWDCLALRSSAEQSRNKASFK